MLGKASRSALAGSPVNLHQNLSIERRLGRLALRTDQPQLQNLVRDGAIVHRLLASVVSKHLLGCVGKRETFGPRLLNRDTRLFDCPGPAERGVFRKLQQEFLRDARWRLAQDIQPTLRDPKK